MTLQDAYLYHVDLEWTARRSGELRAEERPLLEVSAPPEFEGDPGRWTPEHLLVAATSSCLMTTFLAFAQHARLDVRGYKSRAIARLEKIPGEGYRFTEIILMPEIRIAPADVEKALKVLGKAERGCFVSNSLRASVQVKPHFVATAPAQPAEPALTR